MIKHSASYVPKVGDKFKYPGYNEMFTVLTVQKQETSSGYKITTSTDIGLTWAVEPHHKYEWYPKIKPIIII